MKPFIFFITIAFSSVSLLAKGGGPETEALYIVPTPSELVPHSRFIVPIVEAYRGPETKKISYVFPEALVGQPDRLIELTRIVETENSWESEELTAHCTTLDEFFSCNIYVNKKEDSALYSWPFSWVLPKVQAAMRSLCSGVFASGLQGSVQEHFCSNEPAGILSYEFE